MSHPSDSSIDPMVAFSPLVGRSVRITDEGMILGDGTILVRMSKAAAGTGRLALDADRDRCTALMSVVGDRPLPIDAFEHIEAADSHWRRGDKALANLRLIFADLPRLKTSADACRLTLAECLLDEGTSPAELMQELGYLASADLEKYSRDQPRVSGGHGRESGRFGSGGGSQALLAPPALAPAALAPAAGTAVAVPVAGALAFVAAMVIPTPNWGGVEEGQVPDMPGVRFRKDGPAGKLTLTTTAPDGSGVTVVAQNQNGTYVELRTERSIGRDLGATIALDKPAVRAAIDAEIARQDNEEPDRKSKAATDEPEVCPDPEKDRAHGAEARSLDYEEDVHARVNPDNPVKRGDAVRVWDPGALNFIYVDDCFRKHGDLVDGDMRPGDLADAKGPGYERVLSQSFGEDVMNGLVYDAGRQLRAADARGVSLKWYFAERGAADLVRERFKDDRKLNRIVISHMPPRKGSR